LKDDAEMSADPSPGDATRCARAAAPAASVSRALVPALDLSVVYEIADLDQIDGLNSGRLSGFSYARDGHPNAVQLAAKMCTIERAEAGLVCASGMAAIASTLLTLVSQGDHVIISEGLYGKSTTLVSRELVRFGVTHDSFGPASPDSLATLITSRTRLVLVETISNPLLRVSDLEAIARVARGANVPLMVDHTFAPLLCRPI
jgi:cystathionine beta-lyase/cystathionine gamma-synthase